MTERGLVATLVGPASLFGSGSDPHFVEAPANPSSNRGYLTGLPRVALMPIVLPLIENTRTFPQGGTRQ